MAAARHVARAPGRVARMLSERGLAVDYVEIIQTPGAAAGLPLLT
jgi:hypothetical protein